MDIVQIVFLSSVILPAIVVSAIMLFAKYSKGGLKKTRQTFEQKEQAYKENEQTHKKVITSLEKVVQRQDSVLDVYRESQSERERA